MIDCLMDMILANACLRIAHLATLSITMYITPNQLVDSNQSRLLVPGLMTGHRSLTQLEN